MAPRPWQLDSNDGDGRHDGNGNDNGDGRLHGNTMSKTALMVQQQRDGDGSRNGNAPVTKGTLGMEGATAMDGVLGVENGANLGNIIAEAV